MEDHAKYDVPPDQYASVVRHFLSHEDDVTNQRIKWLLVMQGLSVNAYIPVRHVPEAANGVCIGEILITLSAFVSPYKSHQDRGYLEFPGAGSQGRQAVGALFALRRMAHGKNLRLAQESVGVLVG